MPLFPKKGGPDNQTLWKGWLERIQDEGANLSVWEEEFIESVGDQVAAGRSVTEKQAEILERIYTQKVP